MAEEIEAAAAREQFNNLVSALRVAMLHMLKWDHEPSLRSRSWVLLSIEEQRLEIADVLADNPGLKPRIGEAVARAYRRALHRGGEGDRARRGGISGRMPVFVRGHHRTQFFAMNRQVLFDRIKYRLADGLGYLFCELAFKTDCRGPFQYFYRLGCWLYGLATEAGIRCGALVQNPAFDRELDEPFYIRRSH